MIDRQNAQEASKLLESLCAVQDESILSDFLEISKDESVVRSQDYFTALELMADNRLGEQLVWDFVRCKFVLIFVKIMIVTYHQLDQ